MDQRLKKWLRWLQVIHDEVQQMLIARDIFWSVQKLIRENQKIQKPSSFYKYLGDTYISHVLIGIRRQIKIDNESISLSRLLIEISKTPEILSRKYYTELYSGSVVADKADRDFNKFCEAKGMTHISEKMVLRDHKELSNKARNCENFADRRIAHRDKRVPDHPLTFNEVDETVDFLDKLYVKYHLIFHAASMSTLMPTYQYDWQEIFDYPWR